MGSDALTWRDLLDIVSHLPPSSALQRAVNPEWARWLSGEMNGHLLAALFDVGQTGNWMQSKDGKKKRNRPKPLPRPGIDDGSTKYGGKAAPLEDIKEWLGW